MMHPGSLAVGKEEALGIFSLSLQLFQTCLTFDALTSLPRYKREGLGAALFGINFIF